MSEPVFVGTNSSNTCSLDINLLIDAVLQRWSEAIIEEGVGEIPLRWDVLGENWYLQCRLIQGDTLAIQTNEHQIRAETIIWFYNFCHQADLYLYDANTASQPVYLKENHDLEYILSWLNRL